MTRNRYLRRFNNLEGYLAFKDSSNFILPNVSATISEELVFFNPEVPRLVVPFDSIYYKATSKLDFGNGGETLFNYKTSEYSLVSHTYNPETGLGIITFNKAINNVAFQFARVLNNPAALLELYFPDTVTKYYPDYLSNLSNLEKIYLGNGFTDVDFTYGSTLFNCLYLTYVDLGTSITHIPAGIFSYTSGTGTGCPNIHTINMPNVISIDDYAFCNCNNLSEEMIEKISSINPLALTCFAGPVIA